MEVGRFGQKFRLFQRRHFQAVARFPRRVSLLAGGGSHLVELLERFRRRGVELRDLEEIQPPLLVQEICLLGALADRRGGLRTAARGPETF